MARETKNTILVAIIGAMSAVVIAVITTYGTIAVSAPEAKRVKEELEAISVRKIANLPIGSIVPSMLKPTKFAEAVGDLGRDKPEWVLADGRKEHITNSRYGQLTGETTTPDLRGMFLRGMNNGRQDGKEDPNNIRVVGSYQADAFARHNHDIGTWHRSFEGEDRGPKTAHEGADDTRDDGGVETRPKNVAVYFYIKIN